MKKIAVEETLSNVSQYLQSNGYEVVTFRNFDPPTTQIDAIILSGQNENMLGDMTTSTKVPVINAEGMTAEEVLQRINQDYPLQ